MFGDVEKLEKQILDLESRLARARQKRLELQALDPVKRLAVFLHEKFCPYNHTDGCGWGYEYGEGGEHSWSGHAHTRWLTHAREVMTAMKD